jgi:hypothetical protein
MEADRLISEDWVLESGSQSQPSASAGSAVYYSQQPQPAVADSVNPTGAQHESPPFHPIMPSRTATPAITSAVIGSPTTSQAMRLRRVLRAGPPRGRRRASSAPLR